MESIEELKLTNRKKILQQWLVTQCHSSADILHPLPSDASFRRYFRVKIGDQTFIAMDAPPERESCLSFVTIARALRAAHLNAPEIIQADLEQGFLLLTDFGDATYLKTLRMDNAESLYKNALDVLAKISSVTVANHSLPKFSSDFMWQEWSWHKEWFLTKLLGVSYAAQETELDHCYALIVESAATQPQVFMHRDYHSANLMVLKNDVGILDFQDAFIGPVTYDLVSLLRDCYIDWPQELVLKLVSYYQQTLSQSETFKHISQEQFIRWFDWMGVQRHLKALLTFARKHVRDGHSRYLAYVPRALKYLLNVSQCYPELRALNRYLQDYVQPAWEIFSKKEKQSSKVRVAPINRAMILAAGRGERMREMTANTPKPLLRIGKHFLIEYAINSLKRANIKEIVINVSYLAEQIKSALGDGSQYGVNIVYSEEAQRLETAGGILQALPLLGDKPFIVLSSDVISDYELTKLPKEPKGLAHLVMVNNPIFHQQGDFGFHGEYVDLAAQQKLTFGNIGMYRPEIFQNWQPGVVPWRDVMFPLIQQGLVTGEHYHGKWHNIGTPEDLHQLNQRAREDSNLRPLASETNTLSN